VPPNAARIIVQRFKVDLPNTPRHRIRTRGIEQIRSDGIQDDAYRDGLTRSAVFVIAGAGATRAEGSPVSERIWRR